MTAKFELADFQPHESSTFELQLSDAEPIALDLIEVESIKLVEEKRNPAIRQEPFRLTFRGGPTDAYIPQQICKLTHPVMGELEIFLVPLGPDSEGMRYEAIFN